MGFKYCRKCHETYGLVSRELEETEVSAVSVTTKGTLGIGLDDPCVSLPFCDFCDFCEFTLNSVIPGLYLSDLQQSAEAPASKTALSGPTSDLQKAGRLQGGKMQGYVTDEEQEN